MSDYTERLRDLGGRIDLEDRDVLPRIDPHDLCLERLLVVERDRHRPRALHDVKIRDDMALAVPHEA